MFEQILTFVKENKEIVISIIVGVAAVLIAAMVMGYDLTFIPDIAYKLLHLK